MSTLSHVSQSSADRAMPIPSGDTLPPQHVEQLVPWTEDHFRNFGKRFQKGSHRLAETGLFTDEALAELIDSYPRHLLQAFVMGVDPTQMHDNKPVDTTGISGADVIEAVKNGRLWFKLLRIHEWKGPYAETVFQLYEELAKNVPGFHPLTIGAILFFGSTASQVYFHIDAKPNMLWHIRGHKNFWLYPALDTSLVSQKCLEEVYGMVTDEDVPFKAEFDQRATLFDLGPGDVLSWPHNSPHRVMVTEGMSVSLGTLHESEESFRRSYVIGANALLRAKLGIRNPSMAERGVMPTAKSFLFRAARRAGAIKPQTPKQYETSFILDPKGSLGVRKLPKPVLTEFAKGPQGKAAWRRPGDGSA
jgi:hypothetical protein